MYPNWKLECINKSKELRMSSPVSRLSYLITVSIKGSMQPIYVIWMRSQLEE